MHDKIGVIAQLEMISDGEPYPTYEAIRKLTQYLRLRSAMIATGYPEKYLPKLVITL